MTWLSLRELLAIRRQVVAAGRLRHGVHNRGGLYSAVRRPFTAFAGYELFPTFHQKVAALVHSLIAFHPFLEGNESTALIAADVCLRMNGCRIRNIGDAEAFFREIACGEHDVASISDWLEQHTESWRDTGTSTNMN
ncbi:MAG: type II toxin-antitoxin system death-on-curing family toxin [Phycisphaerales bacterium]|nr:type II toxin-antitoxin system death-on-curing family toxin [Phycisphaerales bacterium]